jgi:hypothetical protein
MKKIMIALVCAGAFALSAGEVKIAWDKAKIGDTKIPGWVLDNFGSYKDQVGSGKIIAGSKEGTVAFQVTGKEKNTAFFKQNADPAKPGDIVKITAKIKGRGDITFGYYCYGPNKFVGGMSNTYKVFTATGEFQEISAELEIQNHPKGEEITRIRVMITGRPDCDVIIEDLKYEIISK